jgi:hypothetical protein
MEKMPIFCEIPERTIARDDAAPRFSERGIVSYRCKVYRALLDINSSSDSKTRPLILRTGRCLLKTT